MKHPDFLDNRDFTGEDKKRPSTMSMDSSYQALEGAVKKLSEIASTRHDPRYLQEYIKTGINMAQSAAAHGVKRFVASVFKSLTQCRPTPFAASTSVRPKQIRGTPC